MNQQSNRPAIQPEFGQRLRAMRSQRGMSQAELAEGVANPSYVSMLESGRRTPSLEVIVQLAARLGVSPIALTDTDAVLNLGTDRSNRESRYLALSLRAQRCLGLGDLDAARHLYSQIFGLASAEGDRHWMLSAGMSLEGILQLLGDDVARYRLLVVLDALAEDELPDVRFKVKGSLADAAWDIGLLRDAEGQLSLALALLAEAGLKGTTEHARVLGMLVVVRCDLGDWQGNEDFIHDMLAAAVEGGQEPTLGWAHWSASVAYSLMEQPQEALHHLAEAESFTRKFITRGEWAWFCRSGAAVLLAADADIEKAHGYLVQAEEVLRHNSLPRQRSRLDTVWAKYELATGKAQDAEQRCSSLLDAADPALTPVDRARTQLLWAHTLIALGRPEEAAARFRAAATTFETVGAYRWAVRAWRELDAQDS